MGAAGVPSSPQTVRSGSYRAVAVSSGARGRRHRSPSRSGKRRPVLALNRMKPWCRACYAICSRSRRRRTVAGSRRARTSRRLRRLHVVRRTSRLATGSGSPVQAIGAVAVAVLRMSVTSAAPICGGPGMPQRIGSRCRVPAAPRTNRRQHVRVDVRRSAAVARGILLDREQLTSGLLA